MVLSRLILNLNSERARRDYSNPYELHSTIRRLVEHSNERPLWRLEEGIQFGSPPAVLIQTSFTPDIDNLREYDPKYALSFEARKNKLIDNVSVGDVLCFRLRANPTVMRERKRHGLFREGDQHNWISRQIEKSGNRLLEVTISRSQTENFRKRFRGPSITLQSVVFDGKIEVLSPTGLKQIVTDGVGPAKSFGFGLVTLSRC